MFKLARSSDACDRDTCTVHALDGVGQGGGWSRPQVETPALVPSERDDKSP